MKKLLQLNHSYLVAISTFGFGILCFLITSFMIPFMMDVPLGFLLGGVAIGLLSFLQGYAQVKEEKKEGTVFSIILIAFKFFIIVAVMIVIALMQFKWNLPIFNIYCFIGVYTFSIAMTIVIYVLKKEE